ncbi:peroxidase family protein [Pseudoruegeria sp. HB172150]|uniref:peroxidase family protein n=1 Tax=Pseudoruegeria sp. HB172150 TaxID=2721164 RepID=UPI001556E139|nr:peroxidase family protein [Pseudoruegeria sp. HB172150]
MTKSYHGLGRLDLLMHECLGANALNTIEVLPQIFGYLFKHNPITGNLTEKEIVDGFDALVETMRLPVGDEPEGPAEAGMTFFGQFIDHDITLDATSAIGTRIDPRSIRNVRTPNLDLDCVYGDGPDASPHLYSEKHKGFMLYGRKDYEYDLPRNDHGRALIGDPRNDENIIVSQIQGAFIALHNILMSQMAEDGDCAHAVSTCASMGVRKKVWDEIVPPKMKSFEEVRRFIRLHYQWLILHHFLPSFVDPEVIKHVLKHDPFHGKAPIMPADFSVAAYRFGHATVQPKYQLKKNGADMDMLDLLKGGFTWRTKDTELDMEMYFDIGGAKSQRALPVGPKMPAALFELPDNIVNKPENWNGYEISIERARKLALRNILRDRTAIQVESGQHAAIALGLDPLPAPQVLKDHHIDKTPLWFYCLQEAGEKGNGKLTGVGGKIVASVIIRILKLDPESVLHVHGFEPWSGFGGKDCTMGSVMEYVEKHRADVAHRKELFCGHQH